MAGSFNGTSSYIDLGQTTTTKNKAQLAMSFWANTRVFRDTDSYYSYSTGTSVTAVRFGMKVTNTIGANGAVEIRARSTDGEALNILLGVGTIMAPNTWVHIVGMVDYATSFGIVYINAVPYVSGPFPNTFSAATTSNTDSLSASIGAREDGTAQWINAAIADCRLYDRLLGLGEVQTLLAAKGADGIVAGLQDRFMLSGVPGAVIGSVPNLSMNGRGGNGVSSPTFVDDVLKARRRNRYAGRKAS